jgi:hypothetical protein
MVNGLNTPKNDLNGLKFCHHAFLSKMGLHVNLSNGKQPLHRFALK